VSVFGGIFMRKCTHVCHIIHSGGKGVAKLVCAGGWMGGWVWVGGSVGRWVGEWLNWREGLVT
jgi:hypothetical protein